jgi:hypothetical protein
LSNVDYKFFYDRLGHVAFCELVSQATLERLVVKGTYSDREKKLAVFLNKYPTVKK